MKCPKCEKEELIIQRRTVITTVKNRVLSYERENTVCDNCELSFLTPEQLDINNIALKNAYNSMVN